MGVGGSPPAQDTADIANPARQTMPGTINDDASAVSMKSGIPGGQNAALANDDLPSQPAPGYSSEPFRGSNDAVLTGRGKDANETYSTSLGEQRGAVDRSDTMTAPTTSSAAQNFPIGDANANAQPPAKHETPLTSAAGQSTIHRGLHSGPDITPQHASDHTTTGQIGTYPAGDHAHGRLPDSSRNVATDTTNPSGVHHISSNKDATAVHPKPSHLQDASGWVHDHGPQGHSFVGDPCKSDDPHSPHVTATANRLDPSVTTRGFDNHQSPSDPVVQSSSTGAHRLPNESNIPPGGQHVTQPAFSSKAEPGIAGISRSDQLSHEPTEAEAGPTAFDSSRQHGRNPASVQSATAVYPTSGIGVANTTGEGETNRNIVSSDRDGLGASNRAANLPPTTTVPTSKSQTQSLAPGSVAQTTGTGTQNSKVNHPSHGNETLAAGVGLGAGTGVAAHEYEQRDTFAPTQLGHKGPQNPPLTTGPPPSESMHSSSASGPQSTAAAAPTAATSGPPGERLGPDQRRQKEPTNQHADVRDATLGTAAGVGAGGLAAHELDQKEAKRMEHAQQKESKHTEKEMKKQEKEAEKDAKKQEKEAKREVHKPEKSKHKDTNDSDDDKPGLIGRLLHRHHDDKEDDHKGSNKEEGVSRDPDTERDRHTTKRSEKDEAGSVRDERHDVVDQPEPGADGTEHFGAGKTTHEAYSTTEGHNKLHKDPPAKVAEQLGLHKGP